MLFLAAAAALFLWPRGWWAIGACAIVVSMFVIVSSWTDAKFGALGNLVALTGVVFGFLAQGPISLRAGVLEHYVDRLLARPAPIGTISDADLAHLPAPVQRYLRRVNVVGQPRVRTFTSACTDVSGTTATVGGCRSQPSTSTSSMSRHDCSI